MLVALVPLRGGSKSIPKKNIRTIAGKPLCAWVLEAACACSRIDQVWVSTDSSEIRETVESLGLGVRVLDRPAALAADDSSTEDVMLHFAEAIPFETLCTIQATSPLLSAGDLDEAIEMFERDKYDSLLSAVRTKRFFWADNFEPINYDPLNRPRRQDFSGTLMENGAFYLTRRPVLEQNACRLGGRISVFEMAEDTAVEIDEPSDWDMVTGLLEKRHQS